MPFSSSAGGECGNSKAALSQVLLSRLANGNKSDVLETEISFNVFALARVLVI